MAQVCLALIERRIPFVVEKPLGTSLAAAAAGTPGSRRGGGPGHRAADPAGRPSRPLAGEGRAAGVPAPHLHRRSAGSLRPQRQPVDARSRSGRVAAAWPTWVPTSSTCSCNAAPTPPPTSPRGCRRRLHTRIGRGPCHRHLVHAGRAGGDRRGGLRVSAVGAEALLQLHLRRRGRLRRHRHRRIGHLHLLGRTRPNEPRSTSTAIPSTTRSCDRSRTRSGRGSVDCRPWASWKMSCESSGAPTRLIEKGWIMADLNIEAVAKAAGVHRSTVSRAFSRPEAVKPQTRELILRVAAELGYTMSPLAQALRSKIERFRPADRAGHDQPLPRRAGHDHDPGRRRTWLPVGLVHHQRRHRSNGRLPERPAGALRTVRDRRSRPRGSTWTCWSSSA